MSNIFEQIFSVVFGTLTTVSRAITGTVQNVQDFFVVRVSGLSFVVLGARQVGKTSMIEWLRNNMDTLEDFAPEPTAAGGDYVPEFNARVDGETMRMKPTRDVGGEASMWETDWIELFREARPRGIIFVLDHTSAYEQKDALNFTMQMIEDEAEASRDLRAFFLLVNKSDLWEDSTTLEQIELAYRNEKRRLASLADRRGFKWAMASGSLMTGRGLRPVMKQFFATLRPREPRRK